MNTVATYFTDWASAIIDAESNEVPLLWVSGAQGIGKTTAMNAIQEAFDNQIAILGIDDFYLPLAERQKIAENISPLFVTRGPPGTHDIPLLFEKIDALQNASNSSKTQLPKFDKKTDDRLQLDAFEVYEGRPTAIVLEGWLIGANADPDSLNIPPLNSIEQSDLNQNWRKYQEERLANEYSELWNLTSNYFHLNAPSFETVLNWRTEQEETTLGLEKGTLPADRKAWVEQFILHYERITRRMLEGNKKTGAQLYVDSQRSPIKYV